jgi:prepilin signal peptidase PulO-like enzyme (type II secretory pathway)
VESPFFWIIPVALQGAILGSFLNVVIYRLPLGLSVWKPRWSFCPKCGRRIAAACNVPIVSWLLLRGRCRECRAAIPFIYPLVEVACTLLFVAIWDAIYIARVVPVAGPMTATWPVAVAYLLLFACLLVSAAMDLESYTVHIQVALLAIVAGVLAHATVGPGRRPPAAEALPPALCIVALAMGAAWMLTWLGRAVFARGWPGSPVEPAGVDADPGPSAPEGAEGDPPAAKPDAEEAFHPLPIVALGGLVILLMTWQFCLPTGTIFLPGFTGGVQRGFLVCTVFLFMLILVSMVPREADRQIAADLERERVQARPMALRELGEFVPSLLAGVVALVLLRRGGHMDSDWAELVPRIFHFGGGIGVLAGAMSAIGATILAAALGWAVRILGTLTFGKEAFGTGDIYLMASIAAVGGVWLVLFGFFIASILALVGVLATLVNKSNRAIPFGPWLALGAFVGLWLESTLLTFFRPAGGLVWTMLSGRPGWGGGG